MKPAMVIALGIWAPSLCFGARSGAPGFSDDHLRSSSPSRAPWVSAPIRPSAALVAGIFKQDIDHSGQLPGETFGQRYWVDSEYASSPEDAPVIFHICGEGDAEKAYFLHDNAIEWAKALGAHLVYLEHRYYGKSLPFPDLSTEHLRFLTLDNTIEDLAGFQRWISATRGWRGKWLSVGGSYSGTLSAIYRYRHPELVSGALASSAPMISGVGVPDDGTQDDMIGLMSTDPSSDTGDRQWAYQACTMFGFWEADDTTVFEPSSGLCRQLFGNVALADSGSYNQADDSPFISSSPAAPSNILFTYGTEDIWTTIGLSQQVDLNPDITIRTVDGAGHHFDLNYPSSSDSSAVRAARDEFTSLARKWLGIGASNPPQA